MRLLASRHRRALAELSKEGADVGGKRLWLLQRGKVTACRHRGPAADVRIDRLHPGTRRMQNIVRERGIRRWRTDRSLLAERPSFMSARPVQPEGRVDRASDPIQHHVGEQHVLRKTPFEVAVAPAQELLYDPGRESHGRIGEPVGERLGFGALDHPIPLLFAHPVLQFGDVCPLLICLRRWQGFTRSGQQRDMDTKHAVDMGRAELRADVSPQSPPCAAKR
jgi:hypothetical protein